MVESVTNKLKRFGWVVEGAPSGPDAQCDVPVRVTERAVAVPTIGSIVHNWVLIVPRSCALSLTALPADERKSVQHLAEEISHHINSPEVAFFEHGPRVTDSVVGCGVDQAHLHVVAAPNGFRSAVLSDPAVSWIPATSPDPWSELQGKEYYYVKFGNDAFVGTPKCPSSQYFRKHIAAAAGVPERWDYKMWPFYENVRRTYDRFQSSADGKRFG